MAQITVEQLRKTFANGHTALAGLTFTIPDGQFVCVIGRSGAGKSTLLRCLNASLPLTSGDATVGDFRLAGLAGRRQRALQRSVGFIHQEFNLVGRLSAFRNVLTGRLGAMNPVQAMGGYFGRREREIALDALARVGMLHKAAQRADSLSGGEKQRVAIARCIAQEPAVILADEPVANLDPEMADGVLQDLRRVASDLGVTTVVNIHNIVQARKYAERMIGIAQGVVVFDGTPADLDEEALNRVYRFDRPDARAELAESLDPLVLLDLDRALRKGEKHVRGTAGMEEPV